MFPRRALFFILCISLTAAFELAALASHFPSYASHPNRSLRAVMDTGKVEDR